MSRAIMAYVTFEKKAAIKSILGRRSDLEPLNTFVCIKKPSIVGMCVIVLHIDEQAYVYIWAQLSIHTYIEKWICHRPFASQN